jgi:hypothetical protein
VRRPVFDTENSVLVEKIPKALVVDEIAKSVPFVLDALAMSEKVANGVVVPKPTLEAKYAVPVVVAPPEIVSPPF